MAMLYPTYMDLIEAANKTRTEDQEPIGSRYPIVLAAAKRARQIIEDEKGKGVESKEKPLSEAVAQLYSRKVTIQ